MLKSLQGLEMLPTHTDCCSGSRRMEKNWSGGQDTLARGVKQSSNERRTIRPGGDRSEEGLHRVDRKERTNKRGRWARVKRGGSCCLYHY